MVFKVNKQCAGMDQQGQVRCKQINMEACRGFSADRNNSFFPNCRDDRVSFSSRTRNASGQNEYRKPKKILRLPPSVDFSSRNPAGLVRRASGIPKLRVLVRLKKSA